MRRPKALSGTERARLHWARAAAMHARDTLRSAEEYLRIGKSPKTADRILGINRELRAALKSIEGAIRHSYRCPYK